MSQPTTSAAVELPKLLTANEVCAWLRISRQTLHRAVADGRVPKPLKFGRSAIRFVESELVEQLRRNAEAQP